MTRVPVAILAIALMTSVSGMAFAAQDAAAPDGQPAGANTSPAPTTPAQRAAADRDVAGEPYTAALNLLEAAGYDNFANLRQDGSVFEVTVIVNGQPHHMTVDPASGQIQPHT